MNVRRYFFLTNYTIHIFYRLSTFVICSYFPYVTSKYNGIIALYVCVLLLILGIKLMALNETSVEMLLNISFKFPCDASLVIT